MMRRKLKAVLRLAGFPFLILLFLLPVLFFLTFGLTRMRAAVLRLFYRLAGNLWGLRVRQEREFSTDRPLLVVSNHCTYLDIPTLGQLIDVHFTPKQEIRGWPLIGWLCILAGCVFVDRRRGSTGQNRQQLYDAMQQGMAISLFPEGSTNDGKGLLPFRSAFFSLAEESFGGRPLTVQPVSVVYSRPDGTPFTPEELRKIAWIGEDEFAPHLWEYLQMPGALATVTCLEPVTLEQCGDRKALAKHCEEVIGNNIGTKKERLVAEALPNNGG